MFVVNVVNHSDIHIVHFAVVVKMIVLPSSTFIAVAKVSVAIVDTTVKADLRTPIAFVKNKSGAAPAPIRRSPKIANLRSEDPRAGHPVVILAIPRPITGRPDITVAGTDGLFIDGQFRRSEADGNTYSDLRERNRREKQKSQSG